MEQEEDLAIPSQSCRSASSGQAGRQAEDRPRETLASLSRRRPFVAASPPVVSPLRFAIWLSCMAHTTTGDMGTWWTRLR